MGTPLTGNKIRDTYTWVAQFGAGDLGSERKLQLGDGSETPLSMSSNSASFDTPLTVGAPTAGGHAMTRDAGDSRYPAQAEMDAAEGRLGDLEDQQRWRRLHSSALNGVPVAQKLRISSNVSATHAGIILLKIAVSERDNSREILLRLRKVYNSTWALDVLGNESFFGSSELGLTTVTNTSTDLVFDVQMNKSGTVIQPRFRVDYLVEPEPSSGLYVSFPKPENTTFVVSDADAAYQAGTGAVEDDITSVLQDGSGNVAITGDADFSGAVTHGDQDTGNGDSSANFRQGDARYLRRVGGPYAIVESDFLKMSNIGDEFKFYSAGGGSFNRENDGVVMGGDVSYGWARMATGTNAGNWRTLAYPMTLEASGYTNVHAHRMRVRFALESIINVSFIIGLGRLNLEQSTSHYTGLQFGEYNGVDTDSVNLRAVHWDTVAGNYTQDVTLAVIAAQTRYTAEIVVDATTVTVELYDAVETTLLGSASFAKGSFYSVSCPIIHIKTLTGSEKSIHLDYVIMENRKLNR